MIRQRPPLFETGKSYKIFFGEVDDGLDNPSATNTSTSRLVVTKPRPSFIGSPDSLYRTVNIIVSSERKWPCHQSLDVRPIVGH